MHKFLCHRYKLFPLFCVILLASTNVCYAEALPWDNLLKTLVAEFEGPIPKIMATVFVVMSGVLLMFGETGGLFKRSLQLVFGVSLAINAADWVNYVVGPASSASFAVPSFTGSAQDEFFVSSFMNYFIAVCYNGAANLKGPAILLLISLATIELALSLSFNFEQDHFKYIFKETLKIGFFVFLIQEWIGGTFGIANTLFISFEKLGLIAAGQKALLPDDIVKNGITMITQALNTTLALSWGSLGLIIINILLIAGVVFTTFMMAVEIFMAKVEFWVISLISIPLLPFGILKYTKWLFEKATGAVFSLGIKVMVLSFVSALAGPLLTAMAAPMLTAKDSAVQISVLLRMLLACLVLYVLVKKTPDLAMGLLSGSPSLSGGDMKQSAGSGIGTAAGIVRAGMVANSLGAIATAMPGGRNANGKVNTMGAMKNLGTMAYAKVSAPYHDMVSNRLYDIGKQNQNNNDMAKSKDIDHGVYGPHRIGGDGGEAIRKRLQGNEMPPPA